MILVKHRHRDQWNATENPEIDAHGYAQLTYDKDVKAVPWRNDNLVNQWC